MVLIDDAGPGLPSTFGGEVRTDTLTRIHNEGIGHNRFHTTAMCSPTRASLLTGRNHHRIGNGQIAELANDWDGYAGEIPKSSALGAEVLKDYGYATAAFGKWGTTPLRLRPLQRGLSTAGRPGSGSSTSMASWQIGTAYAEARPAGPLDITLTVNGEKFGDGQVPVSVPLLFSANECLDIGVCLGSPVSLDYYDKAPFPFSGAIKNVNVRYIS